MYKELELQSSPQKHYPLEGVAPKQMKAITNTALPMFTPISIYRLWYRSSPWVHESGCEKWELCQMQGATHHRKHKLESALVDSEARRMHHLHFDAPHDIGSSIQLLQTRYPAKRITQYHRTVICTNSASNNTTKSPGSSYTHPYNLTIRKVHPLNTDLSSNNQVNIHTHILWNVAPLDSFRHKTWIPTRTHKGRGKCLNAKHRLWVKIHIGKEQSSSQTRSPIAVVAS